MPHIARSKKATDPFEAACTSLAEKVARWAIEDGQCMTPDSGLMFYRHDSRTEPLSCMVEPAIALPIQGAKRALLGDQVYDYNRRQFLVTSLDLPVVLQVMEASPRTPYLSLVLRLDERMIAELMSQSKHPPPPGAQAAAPGIMTGDTTLALVDAFDRLVKLLDHPDDVPVLAPLIHREIFYRLLMSNLGMQLWQLASVGSQSHRIGRAIDWLKRHFTESLRVDELAADVQMSASRFHHHFRQLTAMSPLQFQKWLRLNEARRLMLTANMDASSAAFQVGYESASQFSREYSRQFGAPPRRDIEQFVGQGAAKHPNLTASLP